MSSIAAAQAPVLKAVRGSRRNRRDNCAAEEAKRGGLR
jgi:hypothetical protein